MSSTIARNPSTVYNASEGKKFNADTTLEVVDCPTCGVTYAIPASLVRSAQKWHGDTSNGWKICCPLGHTWWYTGETENDRLKRHLRDERDRSGRLASQRDQLQASLRGTRARAARDRKELKTVKARVAHGVCPCCGRSFKQLRRHMKTKHPDYVEAAK